MKTQISFKSTDGSDGVALVDGAISDLVHAKRELAHAKGLPVVETNDGQSEDIDARLRHGGVDPNSVKFLHVSE
ncbi:hypothetical protein [Bordetella muralis]|jgi:hypothetical protein|uniref:hypothetical protein n=1 Tax=Bordetella muralis TaxID=1649130 RepID=UPI0039EE1383